MFVFKNCCVILIIFIVKLSPSSLLSTVFNFNHYHFLPFTLFRLHKIVKEMVHKAFWDLLKEELGRDPPVYNRALILLEEIKEVLGALF